ncbi:hypothetical protein ACF8EF_20725 [Pseudomonas sp. zjy_15]|uniref:hypothetical protein n=1 Tax=Pseudomonas sp. zjy_15 TaxID=3367265 RepID=UPI00370C236F
MAYSSTNPARVAAAFGLTDGKQVFLYESTHAHAAIESTAGFFIGCGFGSPSASCVGMKVGDLLVNVNHSTAGSSAITWHRVTSLTTSTGFNSPITPILSVASS